MGGAQTAGFDKVFDEHSSQAEVFAAVRGGGEELKARVGNDRFAPTRSLHAAYPGENELPLVAQVCAPVVEGLLRGYNASVFTYGQTGTGKTHTMLGHDLWARVLASLTPREKDHSQEGSW